MRPWRSIGIGVLGCAMHLASDAQAFGIEHQHRGIMAESVRRFNVDGAFDPYLTAALGLHLPLVLALQIALFHNPLPGPLREACGSALTLCPLLGGRAVWVQSSSKWERIRRSESQSGSRRRASGTSRESGPAV